jgi:hypothetical protein
MATITTGNDQLIKIPRFLDIKTINWNEFPKSLTLSRLKTAILKCEYLIRDIELQIAQRDADHRLHQLRLESSDPALDYIEIDYQQWIINRNTVLRGQIAALFVYQVALNNYEETLS